MRSTTPQAPSYSQNSTLPSAGYDDPKPGNTANYDSYLTRLAARGNATGAGQPMQLSDPTAGAAVVGGVSYNLDSKNYSFSLPVMSLAGRAGMNVGLGLSYNSKVWTSDAATGTMIFNGDRGFPAPGWQLGFGAIQIRDGNGAYYNSTTGKSSIIFITPDGTRHDMGYNSASARFESYDSSYLKFDSVAQILYSPDGTKMKFGAYSYDSNVKDFLAFPIEIKDRNGNFISIAYRDLTTSVGVKKVIEYVTDTAGRRIDFNYQSNRLTSISQNRNGVTFYYVRLDYQPITIRTRFHESYVTDPININNTLVYFPTRVTYPTGMAYQFGYTSYGQINAVVKIAPSLTGQGGERAIAQTNFPVTHCVDLNLPQESPNYCYPQTGAPYFTFRTEWAENWRGGQAQTYQYYFDQNSGNGPYHDIIDPTGRRFQ
ncbi:MAG: hypothetical protein AAB401_05755, partial [Acidobacteriota bacterium]